MNKVSSRSLKLEKHHKVVLQYIWSNEKHINGWLGFNIPLMTGVDGIRL